MPDGLDGGRLLFPFSEMEWENMADHWLETWEDLVLPFKADDYPNRMQPHNFGDSNFDLQLMTGEELYADDGYYSRRHQAGAVPAPARGREPRRVQGEVPRARRRARGGRPGLLRKYVQNTETTGDPAYFKGTLFELGGVNTYAGVEELWFDDVDAVYAFCAATPDAGRAAARATPASSDDGTYSMVTTERVVFDFVTPGHISPQPAVLAEGTLEALVDAQGYTGWWVPGWEKRTAGTPAS